MTTGKRLPGLEGCGNKKDPPADLFLQALLPAAERLAEKIIDGL
jgi:hypothetical protein